MEQLNELKAKKVDLKGVTSPNGKPHDVEIELEIGTGNKLKPFATFNNIDIDTGEKAEGENHNFGWTIPHGEYPTVGIGGHSQSGGYGHIGRAFGLAIDYIYGFTIVLANGEIRTVNRDAPDQGDRNLYWTVLGGSPGAFGVTTNLVIHPILNKDYPHSTGYIRGYRHSNERIQATLDILEDFINRSKEGDEDAIIDELDLMVTLSSNNGNRFFSFLNQEKDSIFPKLDVLVFELECRDRSNPKAAQQMDEIIEKFEATVMKRPSSIVERSLSKSKWDGKKHKKLSEMSLEFVRLPPYVTVSRRENYKPYRKVCYGSNGKVKLGWSKARPA